MRPTTLTRSTPGDGPRPRSTTVASRALFGLAAAALAACKFPELPPITEDGGETDAATTDVATGDGDVTDAPTDAPGCTLRLVYYSQVGGGDFEIVIADANGTNVLPITTNTNGDSVPKVSPDGTKIVFVSDRDGNSELYVMNLDGTGVQRLTTSSSNETVPTWSPDGTKIAFIRDSGLYVMNADGSGQTLRSGSLVVTSYFPGWTPDSSTLIFLAGGEIQSAGVLTGSPVNLTNTAAIEERPTVSADGTKIAYMKRNASNKYTVNVMNANGTLQQTLVENAFHNYGPNWSPDSQNLVFTSDRDGNNELYKVSAAGGASTPVVVRALTIDGVPYGAWSPDGTLIAYESAVVSGSSEVHVVGPDGTGDDEISVGPQDYFGSWVPCP